jgi:hypothetical protein
LKHNRKFSNYLLDKKLQLRYVIFVTALSAVICGTLGYLIWQQADVATNTIREQLADTPEMAEEVVASLESKDQNLVLTMAGAGVGLVFVLSLFLVVMTHKVAGPLYKVTLHFDRMAVGRLDTVWPLRKGDMLVGFFTKFREMHQTVKERHVLCNDKLKRFNELAAKAGIDSGGDHGHRLEELRNHCAERDKALAE